MNRKHILLLVAFLLTFSLTLSGCSSPPLTESEVAGDYGSFICYSEGLVETASDGERYVDITWELVDPEEGKVKFTYEITDENLECYTEDFWDELGAPEATEDDIWDNLEYLAADYDIPSDGYYIYNREEETLVSDNSGRKYHKN